MCMVSNIGDGWQDQFPQKWPQFVPHIPLDPAAPILPPPVSRAEFEALKQEVEQLRVLLKAAQEFDKTTGQPDCEMDEKVRLIKAIAKLVGVDLKDVFPD